MNLPKAIELLLPLTIPPRNCPDPNINNSIKLGIEALKRLDQLRNDPFHPNIDLLPGETEPNCNLCGAVHTSIECPNRGNEK